MKKEESLLESENVEITENDSESRFELLRLRQAQASTSASLITQHVQKAWTERTFPGGILKPFTIVVLP